LLIRDLYYDIATAAGTTGCREQAVQARQYGMIAPSVFETGRTPQGTHVLAQPLNLIEMIK
jgi:hypothetical protein